MNLNCLSQLFLTKSYGQLSCPPRWLTYLRFFSISSLSYPPIESYKTTRMYSYKIKKRLKNKYTSLGVLSVQVLAETRYETLHQKYGWVFHVIYNIQIQGVFLLFRPKNEKRRKKSKSTRTVPLTIPRRKFLEQEKNKVSELFLPKISKNQRSINFH